MKEHTCYALIMTKPPHFSASELAAWGSSMLSEYTQASFWLFGLKHLLLFGVFILDGMMKQL